MAVSSNRTWWKRFFWKSRFKRFTRDGLVSLETLLSEHKDPLHCDYSRGRVTALRKELYTWRSQISDMTAKSAREADELAKNFARKLRSVAGRLREARVQDEQWANEIDRIHKHTRAILQQAAVVPGHSFQRDCSSAHRRIQQELDNVQGAKHLQQVTTFLHQASVRLGALEDAVNIALRVREEFPSFERQIHEMNTENISANAATLDSYEELRLTTRAIAEDIRSGQYSSAARRFNAARALERRLGSHMNRRVEQARVEIALWENDLVIGVQFGISEFAKGFCPKRMGEWLTLREEIAAYAIRQARQVQIENVATLGRMNKRLGCNWDCDAARLVSFARAVTQRCNMPPIQPQS